MKKQLLIILLLSAIGGLSVNAQCTSSQGANSGSVFVNVAGFSTSPWSQAQNAQSSDSSYASISLSSSGSYSDYLQATGFNFSIPATASICGIELNVERSDSGLISVKDYLIRVVKNNTVTGYNNAHNTLWSTTDSVVTYGGKDSLWGTTWTPAEINDSNFGAAVSAFRGSGIPGVSLAKVDQITIKVFYNISSGLVNNVVTNDAITISPNPSSGHFTITLPVITDKGSIEIYSALGERIFYEPVSRTSKKEINLNHISRGIYVVKFQSADFIETTKLVIEK